MGQRMGSNKASAQTPIEQLRPIPYSDDELKPFFDGIGEGLTYPEATKKAGMDLGRVEKTMDDLEVRQHILNLSMTLKAYEGRHRRKMIRLVYTR